jgi:hypothetical protein
MKQFRIILFLIATSMLLYACPNKEVGHRYINFLNNSEKKIVCQEFVSGSITDADTIIQCRIGAIGINSHSSYGFSSLHKSWEIDFQVMPYIQFLVLDAESYDNFLAESCDTIRKYVPVLKCYRLTLDDLQQMNWTVVYPAE